MRKLEVLLVLGVVLAACGRSPTPTPVFMPDVDATIQSGVATQVAAALAAATEAPAQPTAEPAVTTPTTAPTVAVPTDVPMVRTKMIGLMPTDDYTAFEGLAFLNGISLDVSVVRQDFVNGLEQPDVLVAIYGPYEPNDSELYELADFVEGGGRVLFLYNERWTPYNPLLQQLFGISVVEETVLGPGLESIQLDEQSLPSWVSGLTVVFASAYRYEINTYLMSTLEGGERRYIRNTDLGTDRLIYLSLQDRSITAWPATVWVTGSFGNRHWTQFFHDDEIGYMDNEEAAVGLLLYLAEQ